MDSTHAYTILNMELQILLHEYIHKNKQKTHIIEIIKHLFERRTKVSNVLMMK